jgi:hypothetical protein
MKEGEHFGVIPGTQKPTLLKPGAEKLAFMFRLDPRYTELDGSVQGDDFIHYKIRCDLYHIPSGNPIASGIGTCNSKEPKYRYRWQDTDEKPPKDEAEERKRLGLGRWRQVRGKWVWQKRTENEDIWELDNTIAKMACKRALVAAVLNGTAASDIFTQDLEDLESVRPEKSEGGREIPVEDEGRAPAKRRSREHDTEGEAGDAAPNKETPEPFEDPLWPWNSKKWDGDYRGQPLSEVPIEVVKLVLQQPNLTAIWRERLSDEIAVSEGKMTPAALADRWGSESD